MTNTPRIGDAAHSLWRANALAAMAGNYVESGLDAAPGSSGSAIQSDIDGGTVRFADGGSVAVASDTLPHSPVRSEGEYRMDVIYATREGTLAVSEGQPGQPAPTTDGTAYQQGGTPQAPRRLYWPAPPDGSSISGLPLHVVVLADTMGDSTDLALADYVDYRIPAVQAGGIDTSDFALNRRTYDLESSAGEIVKLATIHDGTAGEAACRVSVWSANATSSPSARALDVGVVAENSAVDTRAHELGVGDTPLDVLVTEQTPDAAGTPESQYHLYARAPETTGAYVAVEHRGDSWGEDQFITGLGPNDVLGTPIRDTGDNSTGGRRRIVAANPDSASVGQVPVFGTAGEATWKTRTYRSGDYAPLYSAQFGLTEATTTSTEYTQIMTSGEAVSVPQNQLAHPMFESDLYISLTGAIRDPDGGTARAVLSTNRLTVEGSEISHSGQDIFATTGSRNPIPANSDTIAATVELKSDGGGTAQLYRPAFTVWGRMG